MQSLDALSAPQPLWPGLGDLVTESRVFAYPNAVAYWPVKRGRSRYDALAAALRRPQGRVHLASDTLESSHSDGAIRSGHRVARTLIDFVGGPVMTTASLEQRSRLRRELGRLDTILFLISAMVVVDTIGAIAIGGAQVFTWLVVLFVFFFIPSALISAELGAAIPEEGGVYVWVRMAFGRFAGALTSLLYWAGTPMWLGGSVVAVALSVYDRFLGDLSRSGMFAFGTIFVLSATVASVVPLRWGKWVPASGAIGQIGLLSVFTVSVLVYGAENGVQGLTMAEFSPTRAVFISVVPVLIYSFVGVELPTTAAEEMRNPTRDIPAAIGAADWARP